MPNSWDRRDGESSRAYHCFTVYLHQGADRSVVAAYRHEVGKERAKQASGRWNVWAYRHEWKERAEAYDTHIEQIALEERRLALRAEEEKWAARRKDIREREFEASEKLLKKAEQILMLPIVEQESGDGKTIIKPVNVRVGDAARMMFVSSLLARAASGLARDSQPGDDEREADEQAGGAKVIRFPVAGLSADEWSSQYKKA